jgi:hypothetical protein
MAKSVLFFRNGRWHAGWVQQITDDGRFTVAWLEGPMLWTKTVDKVIELPDVPWEQLANPDIYL